MDRRYRNLRQNTAIRNMVAETQLHVSHLLLPLFVVPGSNIKQEIDSMPEVFRFSLDRLSEELNLAVNLGITAVLLFVKVEDHLKDNTGQQAFKPNGFMQTVIRWIKNNYPSLLVMSDVALDPYSIYGHDGIVCNDTIDNDSTVAVLCKMALSHAQAGVDLVAPSDMMDGRVSAIRKELEAKSYGHVGIMSYAVKYASHFYGPFRDALDSAPGFGDKKTYQMDFRNRLEAIKEAQSDADQGADILMIKPGLPYLDIVREVRNASNIPLAVYQVSGEYAMLKAATQKGWIQEREAVLETMMAFKRAGTNIIATYYAKQVAEWIK